MDNKKKMLAIIAAIVAVVLICVLLVVLRPWQNNAFGDYTGMTTSAEDEATDGTNESGETTQSSAGNADSGNSGSGNSGSGNSGSGNSGSGNSGNIDSTEPVEPTIGVEIEQGDAEQTQATKPTGNAVIDFDDLLDKSQG